MIRIWGRAAKGLALAGLLVMTACSGGGPRFEDADPVHWKGRSPASMAIHGIDISRYQESIDWRRAAANGVSFAFIKATEGGDYADPAFQRHWRNAAAAGVPRGGYHFFTLCRTGAEQAAWFIANVPRERGALPPVLDVEWNHTSKSCPDQPPAHVIRAEIQAYLNIVGRHYGQQPILYTTPDFWRDNDLRQIQGEQPWLRSVAAHPSEVYPGEHWAFWQYSGTGLVPGIEGEVDLNAFGGSRWIWKTWLSRNTL